jgi:hypothetical protein
MSEDVTSAYGSENTSRGHADVSEPGNESQNVTDFPEAAARRAAVMVADWSAVWPPGARQNG